MELRNLRTFIKVASSQNFTKAGEELGYSQSNVSAQIKQLEQELGLKLFDRIGKYAYLSAYGETLLPLAHQIVSAADQMVNISKSPSEMEGTIRVGMTDSLYELLLESALIGFHRQYPRVRLELSLDPVTSITEQLQHGQLDTACIIHNVLPSSEWVVWDSVEIPIVLVAHPEHPLSRKKRVKPAQLAGQQLILMEASAPYSVGFTEFMESRNMECRPFLRLQSANAACRLVEQEKEFLAVLPEYTVRASAAKGKVQVLSLAEWQYTQAVQLILHRNKVMTPQIFGFLTEIKRVLHRALEKENDTVSTEK